MRILMLLFGRRFEGTYYRAIFWAKCLAGRGHEVTISVASREHRFVSHADVEGGVRILEAPSWLHDPGLVRRLSGVYGWGPLEIGQRWQQLRSGRYDVVHAFEHFPNVSMPLYLTPRARRPLLVCDGCDHYGEGGFRDEQYSPYRLNFLYKRAGRPLRALLDFIEKDLRRRADGVTVISSWLRDRMLRFGVAPERVFVIPGGADVQGVHPASRKEARRRLGLPADAPTFVFLGSAAFDVDMALDAVADVVSRKPDARLLLVGKRNDTLTARARVLGLGDRVVQTGWCSEEDRQDYLAAADLCLLPMRDHAVNRARWPNKIGEYMAAGRPTVCTRVGDVADVVGQEGIGRVCDADATSMAKAILEVLDDPSAEDMGRRARAVAVKRFAPEVSGRRLEDIYTLLRDSRHANRTKKVDDT